VAKRRVKVVPTTPDGPTAPTSRFRRYLDIADNARGWTLGLAIFVPLLIIYVATGNIVGDTQSPDPVAAALPAWHWAAFHTFYLDHVFTNNVWVFKAKAHYVSNRQPGVVFFGIPFYLLLDRTAQFSMFPAVVASATAAAGAVSFLTLAIRNALGTRIALLAGLVVAFGTATWSVPSDTLWPHGPDQLFMAAAMYFLSRQRTVPASIAIALAVPVRAHLAVLALIAGVWFAVRRRSLKPLAVFGAPSLVALAALSAYNHWLFGTWSLNGGYPPYVDQNATGLGQLTGHFGFATNILGSFISLDRGLVIWCPLLVVLGLGLRTAWREAPDWVRISAVAGGLYFLVQMKLNFFSGGDRFWSYRLTIESVTLAAPLFA
jgi:hypothetical protein